MSAFLIDLPCRGWHVHKTRGSFFLRIPVEEEDKEKEGRLRPAFTCSQICNWLPLVDSSVLHALFRFSWNRLLPLTTWRVPLKVACDRQTWGSFYALWFILLWGNGSSLLYFLLKVKGLLFLCSAYPFLICLWFWKLKLGQRPLECPSLLNVSGSTWKQEVVFFFSLYPQWGKLHTEIWIACWEFWCSEFSWLTASRYVLKINGNFLLEQLLH